MSTSATRAKVLFIGVVQDGKVVDERAVGVAETVTVGAEGATFPAAVPALGEAPFPMFVVKDDVYHLRFTKDVSGKVTSRGSRLSLEQVAADAERPHEEGVYEVPLDDSDKGKLKVGAVTLLFKFVEPVAAAAVPAVAEKHDFRPRWVQDDTDPVFLGSLGLWLSLGLVFGLWVANSEVVQVELEDVPERFTKIILAEPASEPLEAEDGAIVDEDAEAKAKAEDAEKPEEKKPDEGSADDVAKAEAAEKAKENVADRSELFRQLQARLIGTMGENSSGTVLLENSEGNYDDIAGRLAEAEAAGASLGDGSRIRGAGATAGGTGDRDVGGVGTSTDLSGGVNLGSAPQVAAPKGRVSAGDLDFSGGDVSEVGKVVRRYQGQLKYCYESSLKTNPSLAGRVVVGWEVAGGAATEVFIAENTTGDDAFAECIKAKIRRWSFEGVADGAAKTPFVFTPQE